MKPPEHKDGGSVSETAAVEDPSRPKPDCHSEIVNRLRQCARFYFNRFQSTGNHLDIHRATAAQIDLVGILEARRP